MAEQSGAVRRPGAEASARPDALAYWCLQEFTPLDAGDPSGLPPPAEAEERPMASGWWLLPVLVLAVPAWVGLAILVF
jgi:hypothetical protein